MDRAYTPSPILATAGCRACEEMGAFCEGVFCGVLGKMNVSDDIEHYQYVKAEAHGALNVSDFLFRMGSDMMAESEEVL